MMRAVLESPSSTRSFLSPGNFDTLKANNKDINKAKKDRRGFKEVDGNLIEDINSMDPSTWIQIADQMNTGKALIGIAANANAAHAIFQHATKLELEESFLFDDQTYNDLTIQYSNSGKLITKNVAELLAAFVDNGKDPQAKYSNINDYTIDVAVSMALVGIDLDTIQYFLTQDSIEDFVSEYKNNGGNKDAENKTRTKFAKQFNTSLTPKDVEAESFNTSELKNYNVDQAQVLSTFLKYKELARPVSNLILAIKQGENGLGPTDSDNLSRMDMFNNSDNFSGIDGAMELLNRKDLFPYHFNEVIVNGRKVIIDKAGLPDRDAGAFFTLRYMIRNYKGTSNLTVNQIEFINKNYMDYLASGFDAFKFDKNLIAELPKRLEAFKKANPDKFNLILSRLNLDIDKPNNITYIVYTGLSGQDKHLVDRIRDDWEAMLLEGNEEESQLAKDLIKYTFMMSGFRISPQSFSHLAPVLYFSETIPEFNKYMREQLATAESVYDDTNADYVTSFYHQFIKNHFRSLSFIPNVDLEVQTNNTFDNKELSSVTLKDQDFRGKDGKLVDYIKTTIDGKQILLVKHSSMMNKEYEAQATYIPTEALGTYKTGRGLTKGKMFTHYNFGGNAVNIFKQNKVKEVKRVQERQSYQPNLDSLLEERREDNTFKLEEDQKTYNFKMADKLAAAQEVLDSVNALGLTQNRVLTLRRLLDEKLLKEETNPFRKQMFDGLTEVYYSLETRVMAVLPDKVPKRLLQSQAWYDSVSDTIYLNIDELSNILLVNRLENTNTDLTVASNLIRRTLLHESIHAFQAQKIKDYLITGGKNLNATEKRLIKKLESLYKFVEQNYWSVVKDDYGMTNIQEFLTEAFSNENFANKLKQISGNTDTPFEGNNIFQKLKSILKEIFKYIASKGKNFNAFNEAKDIMSGLAQEQVNQYVKDLERRNNPNYDILDDMFDNTGTESSFGYDNEVLWDDVREFSLKGKNNIDAILKKMQDDGEVKKKCDE